MIKMRFQIIHRQALLVMSLFCVFVATAQSDMLGEYSNCPTCITTIKIEVNEDGSCSWLAYDPGSGKYVRAGCEIAPDEMLAKLESGFGNEIIGLAATADLILCKQVVKEGTYLQELPYVLIKKNTLSFDIDYLFKKE